MLVAERCFRMKRRQRVVIICLLALIGIGIGHAQTVSEKPPTFVPARNQIVFEESVPSRQLVIEYWFDTNGGNTCTKVFRSMAVSGGIAAVSVPATDCTQ